MASLRISLTNLVGKMVIIKQIQLRKIFVHLQTGNRLLKFDCFVNVQIVKNQNY